MKSIKQHIADLNPSDWDYYHDFATKILSNPFDENNSHSDFIKKYFKRSGKEFVLELIDIKDKEIYKAAHTNSIFFLGILIYKNTNVNKDYFTELNKAGYKEFPFMWFLTCLFHDFAMQQENSEELLKTVVDIDTLNETYKIKYKLLDKKVPGVSKLLFNHIRQYFLFRRFNHKKIDHGILGGIYFYDRLVKNRIIKEKERNNALFWGKELEKQYAQVASAIATHNIWFPSDKTACDYIKFDMKELINSKPISLRNFPLLFLLGLVDTIDPIKTYAKDYEVDYIINNLQLDFRDNTLVLENNTDSELDFNELIKKSDNLNGWLSVDIKKNKNSLEIEFK